MGQEPHLIFTALVLGRGQQEDKNVVRNRTHGNRSQRRCQKLLGVEIHLDSKFPESLLPRYEGALYQDTLLPEVEQAEEEGELCLGGDLSSGLQHTALGPPELGVQLA